MKDTPIKRKPIILCIMDGYGLRNENSGNAVNQANKPNLDEFFAKYPTGKIEASGLAVGLPEGQMGNSEVGHLNMGAGRTVFQSLTLISKSIEDGEFYTNEKYLKAMNNVIKNGGKLHVFALTSDGGVHAQMEHIFAIIKMAKMRGIGQDQLCYHAFLDGRDVGPRTSCKYLDQIQKLMDSEGIGHIATVGGRYWGMDRDKNLSRIDKAYSVMTERKGNSFLDYHKYINDEYARLEKENESPSDEFVLPAYNSSVDGVINDGDSVIFMNFRPDRAIQISTLITNPDYYEHPQKNADGSDMWKAFTPSVKLKNITYICTMRYADSVKGDIAFSLPTLKNGLGQVLADRGYRQLRIAETEKYAHVTFFFDGGINYDGVTNPEFKNSRRVLIPSPKVATYDLKPEMSAPLILDALLKELDKNDLDVVILNFANCDMVGHTAVMPAVIKAVETVDMCVGKILKYLDKNGGTLLLTADHGNADKCIDEEGNPMTKHTTSLVPFAVNDKSFTIRDGGALCDIAPTILQLLGETKPEEMTGESLLVKKGE